MFSSPPGCPDCDPIGKRIPELVPRAGLEPARPFGLGILSPLCLPFHHRGIAFLLGFLGTP